MGFMDELRKLTQPYGDDDDFYEGADSSFKSSEVQPETQNAQLQFENSFGDDTAEPQETVSKRPSKLSGAGGSIFGNLGQQVQRPSKPSFSRGSKSGRTKDYGGASDSSVVLFNPKTFDEAGELVTYLIQGKSLVMALEGVPTDTARRLLDFISGIAFALNGKITPVSAKTYFITPENVDLLDPANQPQPTAEEEY